MTLAAWCTLFLLEKLLYELELLGIQAFGGEFDLVSCSVIVIVGQPCNAGV